MDQYTTAIILTTVGFFAAAFLLLAPVYRFLKREREASQKWTPEELARRMQHDAPSQNGSHNRERDE